jgi:hypothetical protein
MVLTALGMHVVLDKDQMERTNNDPLNTTYHINDPTNKGVNSSLHHDMVLTALGTSVNSSGEPDSLHHDMVLTTLGTSANSSGEP